MTRIAMKPCAGKRAWSANSRVVFLLVFLLATPFMRAVAADAPPNAQFCYGSSSNCDPDQPTAVGRMRASTNTSLGGLAHLLRLVDTRVKEGATGKASLLYQVPGRPLAAISDRFYAADVGAFGSGRFTCQPAAPAPYDNHCFNEQNLIVAVEQRLLQAHSNCSVSGTVHESGAYLTNPRVGSHSSTAGGFGLDYSTNGTVSGVGKLFRTTLSCTNGPAVNKAWYMYKRASAQCDTGHDVPSFRGLNESSLATAPSCRPVGGNGNHVGDTIHEITASRLQIVRSCRANPQPCHPATGDKSRAETDFVFSGRPFVRHYHSLNQLPNHSALGVGWTHGYMERVGIADEGIVYRVSAPGEYEGFKALDSLRYRAENSPDVVLEKIPAGGYRITTPDGEVREFDAGGRLTAILDRDAPDRSVTLLYDGTFLKQVVDSLGRALTFQYVGGRLDRIVLPDASSVAYGYDSDGNLIAADHGGGQVRQYAYHETGLADPKLVNHLTGIVAEDGNRYASFGYDVYGRVKSSKLHGASGLVATTTLDYGTADQASVHTDTGDTRVYTMQPGLYRRPTGIADGSGTTTRTYDAEGRLDTATDARGTVTDYDYQPAYLSAVAEAVGTPQARKTLIVRDVGNRVTRRELQAPVGGVMTTGRVESSVYDAGGRRTFACVADAGVAGAAAYLCGSQASAPAGVRQSAFVYCSAADAAANLCLEGSVRSANGPRTDAADTVTYTYRAADAAGCAASPSTCQYRKGDLWKVTDAKGHITETLKYDGAGRPLSVEDPNDVVTDFEYHPRGWLTARKVRGPNAASETDDRIVRMAYWPTGLVQQVTLPDGTYTTYAYDAAHRLTSVADNAGNAIHYTLDNAGNRTQEDTKNASAVLKRTLSRVYNQLGQLATQADATSNPTDFTYDADGNVETVKDALLRITDHDYDPLNRLKKTLQDVGGIAAETGFEYDAQDNLTKVVDPKGLDTTYAYNGFGDLTQLASPDTGTTAYAYDSAGNRNSQTDARGVVSTYGYDALNRVTGVTYADTAYNVAYAYDTVPAACQTGETFAEGRLSSMTDASGGTAYCYDRFGDLVRKVQTVNGKALTVRYAYTAAGLLSAMTYPDGMEVDYVRNALGRITEVGVTLEGSRQVLLTGATYAPFGPATGWTYGNGRSLARPLDLDYRPVAIQDTAAGGLSLGFGFDAVGNLDELTPAGSATPQVKFGYDALSRLTHYRDGPTDVAIETYGYDKTGNRLSLQNGAGTQTYVYPAGNHRLSSVEGVGRTYDAAGNTTAIDAAGNTLGIDGIAREFTYGPAGRMHQAKQAGAVAMTYRYNGRGEQVRKTTAAGQERYTMYDEAGRWLGDYPASGTGTTIQQVIWLDDLPVGVVPWDKPLHYIEPDHLGTPRVVIEKARNVAVWSWDLKGEAFGDTAPNQNPDGDGTEFVFDMRYPGQRYDSATGLNYNYLRDGYEAGTGRYSQSDPIGQAGGTALYAYVGGNPVNAIDPTGLLAYLCKQGNNIGIAIPVNFIKYNGTTDADISRIINHIQNDWTGRVGNHMVSVQVVQTSRADNVNKVMVMPWTSDSFDEGNLFAKSSLSSRVYAHEAGHWMGLTNVYGSMFRGNIMHRSVGTPWMNDIKAILDKRNKEIIRVKGCGCEQ